MNDSLTSPGLSALGLVFPILKPKPLKSELSLADPEKLCRALAQTWYSRQSRPVPAGVWRLLRLPAWLISMWESHVCTRPHALYRRGLEFCYLWADFSLTVRPRQRRSNSPPQIGNVGSSPASQVCHGEQLNIWSLLRLLSAGNSPLR